MVTRLFALSVLPAVSWFAGCATIYTPPPAHIALLEEEGDLQVAGFAGTQTGGSAAYAVTDELSVRARGHFYGLFGDGEGWTAEAGVGAMVPFGRSRGMTADEEAVDPELGGRFGVSADVGVGSVTSTFQEVASFDEIEPWQTYAASTASLTAQAVVAWQWKYGALGCTVRSVTQQHSQRPELRMQDPPALTSVYTFLEPVVFGRFGAEPVFAELQFGFSGALSELGKNIGYNPVLLGFGLTAELGTRGD